MHFPETIDQAAVNLQRLITTGSCGFGEGVPIWRETINEILANHLSSLNWAGANFAESEWKMILQRVYDEL